MELSSDDAPADACLKFRVFAGAKLCATQGDACVWHAGHACAQATVRVEVIDRHGMFERELHGPVAQDNFISHYADALDMVDRQSEDKRVIALNAQRQMVTLDVKSRSREVENVLDWMISAMERARLKESGFEQRNKTRLREMVVRGKCVADPPLPHYQKTQAVGK